MVENVLKCCPQCGSAAVDYGILDQSRASCGACKWEGVANSLLVVPSSGVAVDLKLADMMADIRAIMAKELGPSMLKFLWKWGFIIANPLDISGTMDRKVFSKYLAGIAAALLRSVLETRRGLAQTEDIRN